MPKIIACLEESPLDVPALLRLVRTEESGAIVAFEGTTRSPNKGQTVLRLEYEAYETVANRELQRICAEVAVQCELTGAVAVHRVGSVTAGETAVVVAAVSHHRDAAFTGARLLIDRIKTEVPLWKKEICDNGSFWSGLPD